MSERAQYIEHVRTCIEQFEGDTDAGYDHVPAAFDNGSIDMSMHPMKAAEIVMMAVSQA